MPDIDDIWDDEEDAAQFCRPALEPRGLGLRPENTAADLLDAEVRKLRRQAETLKEGWRIADEGRIEAEAEVARLTAERDALRKAGRDIVRLVNIHPQGRDLSWFQQFGAAVDDLETALNNVTSDQKTAV